MKVKESNKRKNINQRNQNFIEKNIINIYNNEINSQLLK